MKKDKNQSEEFISGTKEYISRIRNKYDILSESEKQIADYFLTYDQEAPFGSSIKEVAAATSTSVATVVRFCKTLGFSGFAQFKFSVQSEVLSPIGGTVKIGSRDDMGVLKQKVAEFAKQNIDSTILHTDTQELEKAVEAIENCRQIIICAVGTSSGVAVSAANAFMVMGIPCHAVMDSLTMLRTVSLLKEGDVVIGISNCGYIKEVVDVLKISRDNKATTICITGSQDSLAARYADIVLYCRLRDYSSSLDILTVTICQLLTLQALQIGYLSRRSSEASENINTLYSISEMSRYALDLTEIETKRLRF